MAKYGRLYEVFDVHKNEWMPGQYKASEVIRMVGVEFSVVKNTMKGYVTKDRYRIFFAGAKAYDSIAFEDEWLGFEFENFAKEWDSIRKTMLPELRQRKDKRKYR